MKKFLSVMLAAVIIVAALPINFSSAISYNFATEDIFMADNIAIEDSYLADAAVLFEADLVKAWSNCSTEPIDVSEYGFNVENIGTYYFNIAGNHPEYFNLDRVFSYSNIGDSVLTVTPQYYVTGEEYEEMREKFHIAINDALSNITADMSDLEKALAIHDYLCVHAEYDTAALEILATNPQLVPPQTYRAYGVLVNRTGVCQSYSYAYKLLLDNYCGVEVEYCSSEDINHMWNKVQINGNYYHVDVTWDDPTVDRIGLAKHSYFLKSDSVLPNHGSYTPLPVCTDTSFDEGNVWDEVSAKMCADKNDFYYIASDGYIKKYNFANNTTTNIININDRWYVTPGVETGSYWTGIFSGLELVGNTLYYNKADGVYSVNTDGTGETLIKGVATTDGYIYGSAIRNGKVIYTYKAAPNTKDTPAEAVTLDFPDPTWDVYVSTVSPQQSTLNDGTDGTFYSIIRNSGNDDLYGIIEVSVFVDNVKIDTYYQDITLTSGGMEISRSDKVWSAFFGSHSVKFAASYPVTVGETALQNNLLKTRFKVQDI